VVPNFLDAIAIGIEQGLYIENLAWDHLDAIVKRHVKRFIDSGIIEKAGLEREDFLRLIDSRDRWLRARPKFRDVPASTVSRESGSAHLARLLKQCAELIGRIC
jgi:hypothetical protein